MKAYKGFNRLTDGTLMCRDMIYKPGKTYKHEGKIELCESGFHACHELWQTWPFYPNNGKNEFWEVDCGGDVIENEYGDGKFVCSEVRLVRKCDMDGVAEFDYSLAFSEGFSAVEKEFKHNFIDKSGRLLSDKWFDYAFSFREGFAIVEIDNKYNFIDIDGKLLSEVWFDDAYSFSCGHARVRIDGKAGKINTKGELITY